MTAIFTNRRKFFNQTYIFNVILFEWLRKRVISMIIMMLHILCLQRSCERKFNKIMAFVKRLRSWVESIGCSMFGGHKFRSTNNPVLVRNGFEHLKYIITFRCHQDSEQNDLGHLFSLGLWDGVRTLFLPFAKQ